MAAIGRIGGAGSIPLVGRDSGSAGDVTRNHAADVAESKKDSRSSDESSPNNSGLPLHPLADAGKGGAAKKLEHPARNQKVDEVAKLYEKQFLGEMVKAMRSTVSFSENGKPSMAENIYRDQLDGQYVDSWGENGGIGLSDMIYTQLMDRYFNDGANDGAKSFRKNGPIRLSDRDIQAVREVKPSVQPNLRIELKAQKGASAKVQAPWAGEVVARSRVGEQTAVTLKHDHGVSSTLIFQGVPSAEIEPGKKVAKEQVVGTLSPEINSFFLNLNHSKETGTKGLDSGPAASDSNPGVAE